MRNIIIPVSGGKDSQVCVARAVDEYGPDVCEMLHNNTGFDHKLTYDHLQYMSDRYRVPVTHTRNSRYPDVPAVLVGEKIIPNHTARSCTTQLKIKPMLRWIAQHPHRADMIQLLGMRSFESSARRKRYGSLKNGDVLRMTDISPSCPKKSDCAVMLPIVEWTTPAVFTFLRKRGDKINPLYARGHSRVGCYPCVLSGPRDFALAAKDPQGRQHIIKLHKSIKAVMSMRPDEDLTNFFPIDLQKLLDTPDSDPFGFEDQGNGCSWCSL